MIEASRRFGRRKSIRARVAHWLRGLFKPGPVLMGPGISHHGRRVT